MLAVAAIGVIALVGAVVAGVTWRRGDDERQSVKQHQSALDTLRHVSDRVEAARPRPSARVGRSSRAAGAASARSVTARSPKATTTRVRRRTGDPDTGDTGARTGDTGARTDDTGAPGGHARPDRPAQLRGDAPAPAPLVFDDAAAPVGDAPTTAEAGRAARRAMARMGAGDRRVRLPLRGLVVALGALVVVGALVAAASVTFTSSPPRRVSATKPRTTSPPSPTSAGVQPSTATVSTATYRASSSSFTVVLTASGECWVMAVDASGHVVWTGTMAAGEAQSLPTTSGRLVVDLGAVSDVTMTMQGRPVALPVPFRSPFEATFTSAGAGAPPAAGASG